jgi:hypothetical protein
MSFLWHFFPAVFVREEQEECGTMPMTMAAAAAAA